MLRKIFERLNFHETCLVISYYDKAQPSSVKQSTTYTSFSCYNYHLILNNYNINIFQMYWLKSNILRFFAMWYLSFINTLMQH